MAPPAPPQPPQIPPELQKVLSSPSWEDVLGLLKNDVTRAYRVDIETNSTIDAEASQDKQDISELLNALSQFLNGVAPLIQEGVLPFDVAKTMMLAIARRFTFGSQLEDSLQQMVAPPKPDEKPDLAEQMKLEVVKAESQLATTKAQAEMAQMQKQQQIDQQTLQQEQEVAQLELQIKREELSMKLREMAAKDEFNRAQHSYKMQALSAKAEADKAKAKEPVNAAV
jgi:hypothetical protein